MPTTTKSKRRQPTIDYDDVIREELKDPEHAALYLSEAMKDMDDRVFLLALRRVAEAHGMTKVAKKAERNRVSLYKTLSGNSKPQLDTIMAILSAVNLELSISSINTDSQSV
ncbi:MAG: addiction module antidote protein [Pyrinomonadaceae bacterium]